MAKKRKIRADFRKNRTERARRSDWTSQFEQHRFEDDTTEQRERVAKSELTRRRTIVGELVADPASQGFLVQLDVDQRGCLAGRVLSVHGLLSQIQAEDGTLYQCATRRLLKTLSTDQRHVVAAGDRVLFRPAPYAGTDPREGIIERIEPRKATICRTVRGRQHVMVSNVEQLLIVTSAAEPRIKPNLIDRLLVTAEKWDVRPVVCVNKIDLVDPAALMPLVGVYGRMGYEVLLVSASTGQGIDRLRTTRSGKASVLTGQSGVGKSSLLNAADSTFNLPVQEVSEETEKGKHTTTTARLLPLSLGGWVVDTPGIRQFELWDVIAEEVAGYYRDLRPYVSACRFPDCTHTHEAECAVKDAVADGRLDHRRYESYCHVRAGDPADD